MCIYSRLKPPGISAILPAKRYRRVQSTTQYKGDDTEITTATGDSLTAEEYADGFFGGEYKHSNRW